MKINTSADPAKMAAERLSQLLKENTGQILLMLSGGSAFSVLEYIDASVLGARITITVLDERFSRDESVNNFAQLAKTEFYKRAQAAGCSFIDTRVQESRSIEEEAAFFQYKLKGWKDAHRDGKIFATVGIGPDGHTAGILPHPENEELFKTHFEHPQRLIAGYSAEGKHEHPHRITVTNTFLRDVADEAIVYAAGDAKREALAKLLAETGSLAATPARILREMKNVGVFTDQEIGQ